MIANNEGSVICMEYQLEIKQVVDYQHAHFHNAYFKNLKIITKCFDHLRQDIRYNQYTDIEQKADSV